MVHKGICISCGKRKAIVAKGACDLCYGYAHDHGLLITEVQAHKSTHNNHKNRMIPDAEYVRPAAVEAIFRKENPDYYRNVVRSKEVRHPTQSKTFEEIEQEEASMAKQGTCCICKRENVKIVAHGRCWACYGLDENDEKAIAYRKDHPIKDRRRKGLELHPHAALSGPAKPLLPDFVGGTGSPAPVKVVLDIEVRVHAVVVQG